MLKRFSSRDLIIIAVLAAIGIAIKPLVNPTIKMISAPLMLPGGSLAGGLYMMWLVLSVVMVPKSGSGLLFGVVQALVTLILGWFGNHGILSLLTYTIPGIIADLIAMLPWKKDSMLFMIIVCALANLSGSLLMVLFIFSLPLIPLIISCSVALASGALGGVLAYYVHRQIKNIGVLAS